MAAQSNLSPWEKISEKNLNDYGFCRTVQKTLKNPRNNDVGNFVVLNCNDSVQVLAETSDQKLVLVNQFRFGSEDFSLELPAGRLEEGESPIDGAIRELREETGYVGENPQIMAMLDINPALVKSKIYLVKIENCQKLYPMQLDQFEDIETVVIDKNQVRKLIKEHKITNCITLAELCFLDL